MHPLARLFVLALLPLLAFAAACGSKPLAETSKEQPKQYQLHGEVMRLDPQGKTATINAQKIEGWMDAMSMEYPVKAAQDFSKLQPSECIDATVFVQGTQYWVGDVRPANAAPGACLAAKTPAETK
jgi:Cu/Ag efflux protein CusF